ncbi:hypothetical protein [Nonomuraea dietziae]
MLWAAAMLTALAPSLYFWVSSLLSGDDGARYYAHMFSWRCTGAQIHSMIPHLVVAMARLMVDRLERQQLHIGQPLTS